MPIPIDYRRPGTAKPATTDSAARPASAAGGVVVGCLVGVVVGPLVGGVAGLCLDAVVGAMFVFTLILARLALIWGR